jgi:hypothetical protein
VSAGCARCGEPGSLADWRGKILLCGTCWVYLENWALDLEYSIRGMVRANDRARDSLRRGTGYY